MRRRKLISIRVDPPRLRTVALVPVKAHSERLPAKNFRPFAGRPLYRWIIDTLLSIDEIGLVVINTDARDRLAADGLEEGGRILIRDRAPQLCGDFVSMNAVLADDVANVEADLYCMTHATNPLLTAATIREAIARYRHNLEAGSHDSLFTVNTVQSRFYRADGSAVNHDPDSLVRTQDLEPWFEENSNLYLFSRASFGATRARIGQRPYQMPMRRSEAIDIDDADGWELAEAVALHRSRDRSA